MIRQEYAAVEHGTSAEFIEAAMLGVRVAVRHYRLKGIPMDVVRQLILNHFRESLRDEFNAWTYETLMASAARALDHELESCPEGSGRR